MSEVEQPTAPGSILLEDADGPVLVFSGIIDKEAVRDFRLQVPPALWPGRVDLTAVTGLDDAGVLLLVHLSRRPRRQGRELEVLGVPSALRPVLERAGLTHLTRPAAR